MEKEVIVWKNECKQKMKKCVSGDVVFLSFPSLEKTQIVHHGFTTRYGGVSKGIYSSMNLSFTRGDKEEDVRINFQKAAGAIGFSYKDIVCSDQTHTMNVKVVTDLDRGKGLLYPKDYTDVDGMITNVKGLVLTTFYADCVPLYFVDPVHSAIGLSHSGWRGTVGRIGKVTVNSMKREYGTNSKDLLVGIGPSICQTCYEVSEDVAVEFKKDFSQSYHNELLIEKGNGKYNLDLWKANQIVLMEAGIPEENITLPNLCTCCNPQILFSHRASKGKRGNLAAFLGLL